MAKAANDAYVLLEEMPTNYYHWPSEKSSVKKVVGVLELNPFNALSMQIAVI